MIEMHYRSFAPDLEVRSSGDGRTIYGIAVPYNAPTRIDRDLVEQFARGAFNHQLDRPQRVKFAREHMLLGGELIGAASLLRDDAAGLYVELRAARTPKGDETLELVKDGALNELSIMFAEAKNRRLAGGVVERVVADLREVAVVMEGAYGELASAVGVRSGSGRSAVDTDAGLRMQAEEYLLGLPEPTDNDLAVRQIRLGLPF
jgi:HK97 family phage prohead protease